MKKILLLLIPITFCALGCRHTRGPAFDPRPISAVESNAFAAIGLTNRINPAWLQPPSDPFRLGPGDVIEIETIGDTAPRSSLTVGPDGKVYYSLLTGASVWGLTLAETRALLQREMTRFARVTPEFVMNLKAVGSKRVWLLGAVPGAGVYPLATPTTLLEAISAAGGIPTAVSGAGGVAATGSTSADDGVDLQRSFVLREGHLLPVDFQRLLKQGDLSQNIYLQPDDFIFIPAASLPSIYVLGAVGAPNLVPYSGNTSLARVIISAGGTVKYAVVDKVVIIRGGLRQPRMAEVDYAAIVTGKTTDVRLEPGDIVYVPFSPFRRIGELAEGILDQLVSTIAVNYGIYVANPNGAPVGVSSPYGISTSGTAP